jgi:hypothetical protein
MINSPIRKNNDLNIFSEYIQTMSKNNCVPTTEFCDYYNIEWFPINVSINGTEKELNEIMHDLYKSIKCKPCKKYKNDCICKEPIFYKTNKPDIHNFTDRLKERQALFKRAPELFTHLTINTKNIFHIDIDTEDYEDEFDCIKNISPWFPSMTKSYGKHILCKYDGFVPTSSRMQFLNWGRRNEVELLCGIGSYAPFYIENADKPFYDLKENRYKIKLDIPLVSKPKPQMCKTLVQTVGQSDKIKTLCGIIDNKYIVGKGTYDDWKNILWSLHSENPEYKDFAKTMSNREGADYDEAKFEATWNLYNREKEKDGKKITIKTFYNYAKKSDPDFFAEIMFDNDIRHCSNDTEASNLIFKELKDRLISDKGRIFYLKDNIWVSDEDKMRESVLYYIQNSNIYTTRNEKTGEYKPFVQNISKARNVLDTLLIKVGQENSDPNLYDKFHQTTKAKICFNDGVLDFKKKSFTLWTDIPQGEVYSTLKVDRNFAEYFKNPDRDVINKIKDDILKPLYGIKMDQALHFLSRAIAGHFEDKRWATYLGNRNCGKGVEYDILSSAFGEYVSTFELGNLLYNRKSAGMENLDCSKKLYWLIDLEFVRLAISQEVPDIKSGLCINSKIMKKITGGGDEIVARRNFDRKDTHFRSDASYYVKGNSSLLLDSEDCDENRIEFESVVQFKSQDEIIKLQDQYDVDEMERFKIADPDIKDKCRSVGWCNAFTKDDTPILVSDVVSLMGCFDKKKVEAELQSRNIFKKKHTKKGELRDKWVYYGIKRKPPKPLIDSESDNENKEDF